MPPSSPTASSALLRAELTGVILAGGRGSRMDGRDKGLITLAGQPLVAHVASRLAPQVGALLISANRHADQYAQWAPVVADRVEPGAFAGPLAGVDAAMHAAGTAWIVVVPCDCPMLPVDLVVRLAAGLGQAPAAFVVTHDGPQPLACLLARSLGADLALELRSGTRRVRDWLQRAGANPVRFDDAAAFRNLNTQRAVDAALAAGLP